MKLGKYKCIREFKIYAPYIVEEGEVLEITFRESLYYLFYLFLPSRLDRVGGYLTREDIIKFFEYYTGIEFKFIYEV